MSASDKVVTFGMFRKLVGGRGWTPEALGRELRDIQEPTAFFRSVWDPHLESVVIPYRSVLRLYFREQRAAATEKLARPGKRASQVLKRMDL